jgi:hypothetical protein
MCVNTMKQKMRAKTFNVAIKLCYIFFGKRLALAHQNKPTSKLNNRDTKN